MNLIPWGLRRIICMQTLPLTCEDREIIFNSLSAQKNINTILMKNIDIKNRHHQKAL